jgi:hypothetical protein
LIAGEIGLDFFPFAFSASTRLPGLLAAARNRAYLPYLDPPINIRPPEPPVAPQADEFSAIDEPVDRLVVAAQVFSDRRKPSSSRGGQVPRPFSVQPWSARFLERQRAQPSR